MIHIQSYKILWEGKSVRYWFGKQVPVTLQKAEYPDGSIHMIELFQETDLDKCPDMEYPWNPWDAHPQT